MSRPTSRSAIAASRSSPTSPTTTGSPAWRTARSSRSASRARVDRARGARTTVALLNLDLDDFKTVNDSLGHAAGDELLRAIARRLEQRVAAAHLLARHGGDEFMLLLEDLPGDGRAVAEAVAAELLEELRLPFRLAAPPLAGRRERRHQPVPGRRARRDDLLKHADAAMYQAKRAGRGRHALYRAPTTPPRAGSS